ncbi:aminomethyl-transferring glycine dehydrogenase subunit GcvPB [Candidatus Undinarchaeota archaeon]
MYKQAHGDSKVIFERSDGSVGYSLPKAFGTEFEVPEKLKRKELNLPEVSEVEIVRHYTNLSQRNFGVDNGFYPLGSCTMKYNPKINEAMAVLDTVTEIHPEQIEESAQGSLELVYNLGETLKEVSGLDAVTLQPAAGAHGEYTGCMIIRAYHRAKGQEGRDEILVPDSAHGTNPASAAMAGFKVIVIPSLEDGTVDLDALKAAVTEKTAGLMLTNPNTLGIFEHNIKEISKIVHEAGGLLYYDGANLNAIMGFCKPGEMGFDVMHINLHKTFGTPHGGGGPGSGPVLVKKELAKFLPTPIVEKDGEKFKLNYDLPESIGPVKSTVGNFGVLVKAYAYILSFGNMLKDVSEMAVLNSNYMAQKLKDDYEMPGKEIRKHEFVLSGEKIKKETGCSTGDIGKRLLDYGLHAPTIYFPLIVHEALMIEPTETETKENLDNYIDALKKIKEEAYSNPDALHNAPENTAVRRLDVTKATREPILSWKMFKEK